MRYYCATPFEAEVWELTAGNKTLSELEAAVAVRGTHHFADAPQQVRDALRNLENSSLVFR